MNWKHRRGGLVRHWMAGFATGVFLIFVGCAPKQTPALAMPLAVVQEPPTEPVPAGVQPGEDQTGPADSDPLEVPAPEIHDVSTGSEQAFSPPDPRQHLESALTVYQAAQDQWKSGQIDEALRSLDDAFALILQIDTEEHLDILQEKEDLRYLISKRIVEIYASQKTVVGDLRKAIPVVMNEHVKREIRSFQNREKRFFLQSYARSGRFRPMILEALKKEGLPEQMSWLPLIESGFKTSALSRARALGLWQFISSTGYRYGLSRNQWVDERMDPEKATTAAIQYLLDLHNLFGDWLTALAAYNCGERRVLRTIQNQKINYLDNFWDLYQQLPRETARYVPRFLATLIILEDPEAYGFALPPLHEPMDYEEITIAKSVRLADLENLAGSGKNSFKQLNPELRYGVTPDKDYQLRVPNGTGGLILDGIAAMPRWSLPADSYLTHVVRRGETLSLIAQKYRTSTNRIVQANRLPNMHRIWPGQRLKVPGRGGPVVTASSDGKERVHRVVRGDSLWRIARQYKTTVGKIRAWNNLTGDRLQLGQTLVIRPDQPSAGGRVHKVRRGDTMAKIAKRYGVDLQALLKENNMRRRDRIYPNQTIMLPDK